MTDITYIPYVINVTYMSSKTHHMREHPKEQQHSIPKAVGEALQSTQTKRYHNKFKPAMEFFTRTGHEVAAMSQLAAPAR